jgi:hypothetical protein
VPPLGECDFLLGEALDPLPDDFDAWRRLVGAGWREGLPRKMRTSLVTGIQLQHRLFV